MLCVCVSGVCMYRPQEHMHVCVYMCDHAGGIDPTIDHSNHPSNMATVRVAY